MLLVHPDEIQNNDRQLKAEISALELKVNELLVTNMNMKTDLSEVGCFS